MSSRAGRFFCWPGHLYNQACTVSARDAEHHRQSLMLISKITSHAAIELRQSFDSIGKVAAVVESRVPHDDGYRGTWSNSCV